MKFGICGMNDGGREDDENRGPVTRKLDNKAKKKPLVNHEI